MANVCILRHQGHIKSKTHFPYQQFQDTEKLWEQKH